MVNIIHIFGASGSGTTTLGKAIYENYGHIHLDTDNYFWVPTDPPYTTKRNRNERQRLLNNDINKNEKCVISGSLCGRGDGWGDIFIPLFDLVIFIDTPMDVRIKRLEERELNKFGNRILPGGDMYDNHTAFIEWAKTYDTGGLEQRSRVLHMQWMEKLTCKTVTVDGTLSPYQILLQIDKLISG
ncbi:AAA family ATPase [Sedimentibacter sp.]|uniref:AAA family ATPase n=1 Tax=Sedimentibacter sp. TaxID=1960295 RepID=UPI0028AACF30|nr:AAA family ATPase [Sedimentibacter sp.]